MSDQCKKCGYDGRDGWRVGQVGETQMGDSIDAWFCPECGEDFCTEGDDCPPDEFGQYKDEPGGFTKRLSDRY